MKARGIAMPLWGLLATGVFATACSSQDPAFTEDKSVRPYDGLTADSVAAKAGGAAVPGDAEAGAAAGGATSETFGPTDADAEGGLASGAESGAGPSGDESVADDGQSKGDDDGAQKDDDHGRKGDDHGQKGDDASGAKDDDDGDDDMIGPDGKESSAGLTRRTVEAVQGGPGKVDILWVVDTSGSMSEEQSYLAKNFKSMIEELKRSGHDFQTAVTTTDVCQDKRPDALEERVCPVDGGGSPKTHLRGRFVGDETGKHQVLHATDADLIDTFTKYAMQGIDGSGFEHGLWAAKLAFDKVVSGENESLIRDDAFLAVIVVSDEEDDGIGLSMLDVYSGKNYWKEGATRFRWTDDDMIAYLKARKGEGHFSISTIAPTRGADGKLCSAKHSKPEEEGTQYIKAAQKTGGIVQSICETNWSASLAKIGVDLSAQLTQVVLPSAPDVATIKVYVDDVAATAWSYNAGNNAVKFDAGHVPAEGAKIKVTYLEAQ